jgi:hypothetical protein
MAVSAVLVAAAMGVTVEVLAWVLAERRAVERRHRAVQEAANLMEHIAAEPWERVTPERARAGGLSPAPPAVLPGAEWRVSVEAPAAPADLRRIAIRLRWRNRAGDWEAPVRLAAWVARRRSPR